VLTHAERKTWAEHRGARSQESSFSKLADMEFIFRSISTSGSGGNALWHRGKTLLGRANVLEFKYHELY
jgi:hypothetical protein